MQQIVTRHRHELKRRTLTVREVNRLTPHMIRIILSGDDLADFTSLSPDDHVKIFVPAGEAGSGEGSAMRDYTPRAFDRADRSLTLDFAVHEAGPATRWALDARPGDTVVVGGPRGSAVVAPLFDWWLLIGDETALPAIARRAEELREADAEVVTLAAVASAADEQVFAAGANHSAHWVHRPVAAAADPAPLLDAVAALTLPEGNGFVWIAAEAGVARALRDHFLDVRGHPRAWMKAAGYWKEGIADGSDKALD
ncbi:siderophore-interacting protein [Acuticoccus kandeliae]|uniref:siderophore-interacting protein n=1 Tax=Acuticoccus kandeliae TaxID=2073160 RepID=UPI000D3E3028|nr:siderophore-interacting protein [Acuticoccus kandeliae]